MSVNMGTAIGYLELDTSKFTSGFKSAMTDMETFQNSSSTTTQKLGSLSKGMVSVGSTLTKSLTLPLVGVGAAITKTTAEFEAGMSEVGAISGATGSDLEALADKAKELGAKTKFSATESAEALKYMAMAGWDTEKMLGGLEGVMNLAAASGEELGTVSDIVTDALTAFGMKAEESSHFADVLAKASSKSNTNVGLMGETFKYVAPVAGSLGFSCEDAAVAIGLMANSGIKGSQAGTALRSTLTRLAKPTKESATAMEALGLEITNSDGSMKSFMEIMVQMRQGFSGLTEEQKASYAAMLGGQEAMSGLLAIVNSSDTDFQNLVDEIYNADGAAQQMADTMNDNLSGQLTILKSTIEGIALQFGDIMLPAIKSVVQGLQNFATWLNGTSETTKTVITVIATVVAALGPLLLIGGKLLAGFLQLKTLMSGAGLAMSALTGPIGIVVAALAALALAWTTNFGGIRDTTASILTTIKDVISNFLNTIKYLWNNNFLLIKDTVSLVMSNIETVLQAAFGVIEGLVQVFGGIFSGDWTQVWEGVKKIFSSIWTAIKNLLKNFLNFIVNSIIKIGANLWVAAKNAFQRIKDGFLEKWNAIKEWFAKVKEDPVTELKKIPSKLFDAGKEAFNKLWDGFKSVWTKIKNWFGKVGDWIESKLKFWKKSVKDAEKTQSDVDTQDGGSGKPVAVGSFAKGLEYVPYDGFPAILHKGERVLTKSEASSYNKGTSGATYQFTFNSPQELSPAEQRRQFKKTMNELLFSM